MDGPLVIRVVPAEACPLCRTKGYNRPKVHDGEAWWWRCYNTECIVQYYCPDKRLAEVDGKLVRGKSQVDVRGTMSYDELKAIRQLLSRGYRVEEK